MNRDTLFKQYMMNILETIDYEYYKEIGNKYETPILGEK